MLVLTRKCSERIHIGDGIVIKVIKTGRNSVKLGIEAPDDVRIMRSELCEPATAESIVETKRVRPSIEDLELDTLGPGCPSSVYCSDHYPQAAI